MNKIENESQLIYENLLEKKNQALSKLINTLSEKQFRLLEKYLQSEEKLRKQEAINLIQIYINSAKNKF